MSIETAPTTENDPQEKIFRLLAGECEPESIFELQLKLAMELHLSERTAAELRALPEEKRREEETEAMHEWINGGYAVAFHNLTGNNTNGVPRITLADIEASLN